MKRLFPLLLLLLLPLGCGGQTVSLSGTGVAPPVPGITVTPTSVAFGNVFLGQSASQAVQVSSTGTANLQVTAITISGPEFALTNPPKLPLVLAPGTGASLNVAFNPTAVGSAAGALSVTSNATPPSNVASVPLSGTVTSQNPTVDLTWQAGTGGTEATASYNVYRGASGSGIYVAIATGVTTTAYADASVVPGQSYDYVVKAVGTAGDLSAPSNVFSITIP